MSKHSVHLRPMDPRTRRWYLLCIGSSITLVLVAWILSIHAAISGDVTQIQEDVIGAIERAGARYHQAEEGVSDYAQDVSSSFEQAKASYEEAQVQQ